MSVFAVFIYTVPELKVFWLALIMFFCLLQLNKYFTYNKYLKYLKLFKVKISKNNSRFKYTYKGVEKEFNKSFVRKIVYCEKSGIYSTIPGCHYSKIILKNGEYLILPEDVISNAELIFKFSRYNIKIKTKLIGFSKFEEPTKLI